MYVCMYVCQMYVCQMYVCMYVCVYLYIHQHFRNIYPQMCLSENQNPMVHVSYIYINWFLRVYPIFRHTQLIPRCCTVPKRTWGSTSNKYGLHPTVFLWMQAISRGGIEPTLVYLCIYIITYNQIYTCIRRYAGHHMG